MITNIDIYNQGTTQRISFNLKDETLTLIPTSSLSTLTATLYDKLTGAIINSRSAQSIINTNGGTYTDGAAALVLGPLDSPHLGGSQPEEHILLLQWTYNSGVQGGKEEILLRVRDVGMVA